MNKYLLSDKVRLGVGDKIPKWQYYMRKAANANNRLMELIYAVLCKIHKKNSFIEISYKQRIGYGLYVGHPYLITINPGSVLGNNINIHRGVTIGQENRGKRKGCPIIGDKVWIGINSTIVGGVTVGDDVLIAPNTYVNCDIPSHSIVFGNPCIIKHRDNATEGYINRTFENNEYLN